MPDKTVEISEMFIENVYDIMDHQLSNPGKRVSGNLVRIGDIYIIEDKKLNTQCGFLSGEDYMLAVEDSNFNFGYNNN